MDAWLAVTPSFASAIADSSLSSASACAWDFSFRLLTLPKTSLSPSATAFSSLSDTLLAVAVNSSRTAVSRPLANPVLR